MTDQPDQYIFEDSSSPVDENSYHQSQEDNEFMSLSLSGPTNLDMQFIGDESSRSQYASQVPDNNNSDNNNNYNNNYKYENYVPLDESSLVSVDFGGQNTESANNTATNVNLYEQINENNQNTYYNNSSSSNNATDNHNQYSNPHEDTHREESEPGVPKANVIWKADESVTRCANCIRSFKLFLRRHHCRACGNVFCDACSSWKVSFAGTALDTSISHASPHPDHLTPQRVCRKCYEALEINSQAQKLPTEQPIKKMKLLLVAIGGMGDVLPYIALAASLKARGHSVTLATDSAKEALVTQHHITFALVEGNPEDDLLVAEKVPNTVKNPLKLSPLLVETIKPLFSNWLMTFEHLIQSETYDMCICNAIATLVGLTPLERRKTPFISSWLFPVVPTKYYAPPILSGSADSWFQLFNQVKWNYASSLTWGVYKEIINHYRKKLDLVPYTNKNIIDILIDMKAPIMNNWSPTLFCKPSDWSKNIEVTGALLVKDTEFQAPQNLIEFLAETDDKPIYIGFGNMMKGFPELLGSRVWEICFQALSATSTRAVISIDSCFRTLLQAPLQSLGNSVCLVEYVSHEWLFPQVSAAVIHGGIGTTMCALRHSIVPVILSFGNDQPFWGDLLFSKGLAPPSENVAELTLSHLVDVLKEAIWNETYKSRVKETAQRMNQERGNEWSVEFVERFSNYSPQWPSYLIPAI